MIRKIIMGTAWMMVSLGLYAQNNEMLTDKDKIIVTISAYTARGELAELKDALNRGLDVGLTIVHERRSSELISGNIILVRGIDPERFSSEPLKEH